MAVLVLLATVVNYIDRLTVSILAPVIQKELGLSNLQYAGVTTWFLLLYAVGMPLFGKIYDRLGTYTGFCLAVAGWSLASIGHAAATGLRSLSAWRAVLGFFESGNWPGATKGVAEWFPARERALAMGIVNCGAALGPVVATPLVVFLQLRFGWQAAFVVTGTLGLFWLLPWWMTPRLGAPYPVRPAPADPNREGEGRAAADWRVLLRDRRVWGVILARTFGDPIWWLYLMWLPLYLFNVRGFTLQKIGLLAWIPYMAAALGSLAGGGFSSGLIARGWSRHRARRTAILLGSALLPLGGLAPWIPSAEGALALVSLILFAFQFWVNNVQTIPSDLYPSEYVGAIAGFSGGGAALGAMTLMLTTGWVVDHFSYTPILILAAILGPLATGALLLLVGRPERTPSGS